MERLDSVALNIELTLISIIQGVALYFLVESSRSLIVDRDYAAWPYIATGLLMILIFWSRSLLHSLTLVRWPLEFGRNFLYVTCTLIEAIVFTQVKRPEAWFCLNAAYAIVVWILFVWDLASIARRKREAPVGEARDLYLEIEREQRRNIVLLMPMTFAFNLGAAAAIRFRPDFFLAQGWDLALIGFQFIAALVYLIQGVRFYHAIGGRLQRIVAA